MKTYYDHQDITIYHGDCREVLPTLPKVDLVLTDPPYGIGLIKKTNDCRSAYFDNGESLRASVLYTDDPNSIRSLIVEVIPLILAISDRIVIFPGPAMLWEYPKPMCLGCVFTINGAGRCSWGFQCMHPVLFYGKDPLLQDGKGGRSNSLLDNQRNPEKIDHPCPKPLVWMTWALNRASRLGESILDPFMGSGTTLVAAKRLGRKAIGIEIEEKYCEIAAERIENDMPLFSSFPPVQEQLTFI